MPQYLCAVKKGHTKYFGLPVDRPLQCCGKPMILQGAPKPAASPARPAAAPPAEPQRVEKGWWQFWK